MAHADDNRAAEDEIDQVFAQFENTWEDIRSMFERFREARLVPPEATNEELEIIEIGNAIRLLQEREDVPDLAAQVRNHQNWLIEIRRRVEARLDAEALEQIELLEARLGRGPNDPPRDIIREHIQAAERRIRILARQGHIIPEEDMNRLMREARDEGERVHLRELRRRRNELMRRPPEEAPVVVPDIVFEEDDIREEDLVAEYHFDLVPFDPILHANHDEDVQILRLDGEGREMGRPVLDEGEAFQIMNDALDNLMEIENLFDENPRPRPPNNPGAPPHEIMIFNLLDDVPRPRPRERPPRRKPASGVLHLPRTNAVNWRLWTEYDVMRWGKALITDEEEFDKFRKKKFNGSSLLTYLESETEWKHDDWSFGVYVRLKTHLNRVINESNEYFYESD